MCAAEVAAANPAAVRVQSLVVEVGVRQLQDERAPRRREVEHDRGVEEIRQKPVRAQARADRDRAPAHDDVVDRARRHELHARGLREPHPHVAEEEVRRHLRPDRDGVEAGPRALGVGRILRADAVLIRLAEHERRVVVEVREAENASENRVEQRKLERVERAENRVRALRVGPERAVERSNLAPVADDEPAQRVGELSKGRFVELLARQQPAARAVELVGSPPRATDRPRATGAARPRRATSRPLAGCRRTHRPATRPRAARERRPGRSPAR